MLIRLVTGTGINPHQVSAVWVDSMIDRKLKIMVAGQRIVLEFDDAKKAADYRDQLIDEINAACGVRTGNSSEKTINSIMGGGES